MNKESLEYKRVIKYIAQCLYESFTAQYKSWEECEECETSWYFEVASSILAIEGIAVLADNQKLPDYAYGKEAIIGVRKANFKRVV